MFLRYTTADGNSHEIALTEQALTIGRSPDADLVIDDERASRLHCGIRFEKGVHYLRDLQSKNGTLLNEERIEAEPLKVGDRFRIGSTTFRLEAAAQPGPDTAVQEVEGLMADGKGYGTILREIVDTVDKPEGEKP